MSITDIAEALKEPFAPKFIDVVDKGSHKEDYVNHAVVTDRLNRLSPDWSLKILHIESYGDDKGLPHVAGVHVALTLEGITREEVGTPNRASKYGDELKNAVSDAIKRAAMRFGVAIQLWHELETVVEGGAALASSGGPGREVPPSAAPVEAAPTRTGGTQPDGSKTETRSVAASAPSEPVSAKLTGSAEGVGGNADGEDASSPPPQHHDPVWRDSPKMKGWEFCSVPSADGGQCWVHPLRRKSAVSA